MRKIKGQTLVEYIVLLMIVIFALVAFSSYFKRGIQGRWKAITDDLGDQYDPRFAAGDIMHHILANTDTRITTIPDVNGFWTFRTDATNSFESQTGSVVVGSF